MSEFGGGNVSAVAMSGKFVTEAALQAAREERDAEAKALGQGTGAGIRCLQNSYQHLSMQSLSRKKKSMTQDLFMNDWRIGPAERKRIEEEEFAEKMRFSNLVKRLDDEEYEFLSAYDDEETKRRKEIAANDRRELEAFRKAVSEVASPADHIQLVADTKPAPAKKIPAARDFQSSLLNGIVRKRKSESVDSSNQKSHGDKGADDTRGTTKRAKGGDGKVEQPDNVEGAKDVNGSSKPTSSRRAEETTPNPLGLLSAYPSDSDEDTSE
ncbi:uncharacterized protein SPPG_08595 [Spizellomyces punctatus DAOM BR117]|uniref:FAM192A/Fyv6 N-terminal domain-containing protein n=1 Tax=Spizellomyces punctatus (strain DAOM BR117) TaxID=645134 RepID=A0A0L0H501_SPIPD|nr:uncharacterized protein SPPG_08595 [Spizellomyces punctatus DAOM BR117]KNC95996.1 hypothetical protein SPPG_08595 [Spizellomyces punctatus DAOM BR117]|eukprot:XP_016604036.1 hypothetical protein SPPG_08595 [Spizellomyces punctatus DAOM BR117]